MAAAGSYREAVEALPWVSEVRRPAPPAEELAVGGGASGRTSSASSPKSTWTITQTYMDWYLEGQEPLVEPVLRLFGRAGNIPSPALLHVHGYRPRLFLRADPSHFADRWGNWLVELKKKIELLPRFVGNASGGRPSDNLLRDEVVGTRLCKAVDFYGFRGAKQREEAFVMLELRHPMMCKSLGERLARDGVVLFDKLRMLQPYETHLPYVLQFMSDYKIGGMGQVSLSATLPVLKPHTDVRFGVNERRADAYAILLPGPTATASSSTGNSVIASVAAWKADVERLLDRPARVVIKEQDVGTSAAAGSQPASGESHTPSGKEARCEDWLRRDYMSEELKALADHLGALSREYVSRGGASAAPAPAPSTQEALQALESLAGQENDGPVVAESTGETISDDEDEDDSGDEIDKVLRSQLLAEAPLEGHGELSSESEDGRFDGDLLSQQRAGAGGEAGVGAGAGAGSGEGGGGGRGAGAGAGTDGGHPLEPEEAPQLLLPQSGGLCFAGESVASQVTQRLGPSGAPGERWLTATPAPEPEDVQARTRSAFSHPRWFFSDQGDALAERARYALKSPAQQLVSRRPAPPAITLRGWLRGGADASVPVAANGREVWLSAPPPPSYAAVLARTSAAINAAGAAAAPCLAAPAASDIERERENDTGTFKVSNRPGHKFRLLLCEVVGRSVSVSPQAHDEEPPRTALTPRPATERLEAVTVGVFEDGRELCLEHIWLADKLSQDETERPEAEKEAEAELSVLLGFAKVVQERDPDAIGGYEIQFGSLGYMVARAEALINDPALSRDSKEILDKWWASMSRTPAGPQDPRHRHDENGKKLMSDLWMPGRHVLNLWRVLRKDVTLTDYSLENLSREVLKKPVPKISRGVLAVQFCSKDFQRQRRVLDHLELLVRRAHEVVEHLTIVTKTAELSMLNGIDFFSTLTRGSQYKVEGVLVQVVKPLNYVMPSPDALQVRKQPALRAIALCVSPSSTGHSDPVAVFDFRSLYPSLVIAHNLCYSTLVGWWGPDGLGQGGKRLWPECGVFEPNNMDRTPRFTPCELAKLADDDQLSMTPNGSVFVRAKHLKGSLPVMLSEILNLRFAVKDALTKCKAMARDAATPPVMRDTYGAWVRVLDARQFALKMLANVTYGYTASSATGRMPCSALGDAIVSTGSATLQRAQSLVMYPTEKDLETSQRAASQRSSQTSLHALDEAVEQQRQQEKRLLSQEKEELLTLQNQRQGQAQQQQQQQQQQQGQQPQPQHNQADQLLARNREQREAQQRYWREQRQSMPSWARDCPTALQVVYGDTDSLFVLMPNCATKSAFAIADAIALDLSLWFPHPVKLQFQCLYAGCVIVRKKKYCGHRLEHAEQRVATIDSKGLENIRRDSCPLVVRVINDMFRALFNTRDLSETKRVFLRSVREVYERRRPVSDFILSPRFREYKNPSAMPPHAVLVKKMLKQDPGAEVPYKYHVPLVIAESASGDLLRERAQWPSPGCNVDVKHYVEVRLLRPVERIFNLFGCDVRGWFVQANLAPKPAPSAQHQPQPQQYRQHQQQQHKQQNKHKQQRQMELTQVWSLRKSCEICNCWAERTEGVCALWGSDDPRPKAGPGPSSLQHESQACDDPFCGHDVCASCRNSPQDVALELAARARRADAQAFRAAMTCSKCSELGEQCSNFRCDNLFLRPACALRDAPGAQDPQPRRQDAPRAQAALRAQDSPRAQDALWAQDAPRARGPKTVKDKAPDVRVKTVKAKTRGKSAPRDHSGPTS